MKKGWRKEGGFLINSKENKSLKILIRKTFILTGRLIKIAKTKTNQNRKNRSKIILKEK